MWALGKSTVPLRALLWKHKKFRSRHLIVLLISIILPTLILGSLAYFYKQFSKKIHSDVQHTEIVPNFLYQADSIANVYYSPNNSDFINSLMGDVSTKLDIPVSSMIGFYDKNTLLQVKLKSLRKNSANLAVIFKDTEDIYDKINYTIRNSKAYQTDRIVPSVNIPGPHEERGNIYSAFATLQLAIDSTYIEKISKVTITKNFTVQPYPYPSYTIDDLIDIKYVTLLPIFIINCYFFLFLVNISRLVNEKASGMHELMKIHGVSTRTLWFSYYIHSMVIRILLVFVIVSILKMWGEEPLIPKTNCAILFFSILLYANYIVSMSFLISTFFKKSSLACIVVSILWLIFQLTPKYFSLAKSSFLWSLFISIVHPNILVFWIFEIIGTYEMKNVGAQWNDFFSKANEDFTIPIAFIWTMLLFNSILFMAFSWYIDQINPGTYGIPKPILFLFKRSFNSQKSIDAEIDPLLSSKYAVILKDVSKVYSKVEALSNVSLKIKQGGITVLLGHNGAGKTTLMSIITGMHAATKGSVHVNGKDMNLFVDDIRSSVGFCPQNNLTFTSLTVLEHVILNAKLKNMQHKTALDKSKMVLERLDFPKEKFNEIPDQLSNGMRRKLQMAMALVGSPSLLVMDEPTSGLDFQSRRELWNLLFEIKKTCTILISTHLMEEAEVLADSVLILNQGILEHSGTLMDIKKKFGTGYKLDIHSNNIQDFEEIQKLPVKLIHGPCKCPLSDCRFITITVPENVKNILPTIIQKIEAMKTCDRKRKRLSASTLEDIFMRLRRNDINSELQQSEDGETKRGTEKKVETNPSWKQIGFSLTEKNWIHTKIFWLFKLIMLGSSILLAWIIIFNGTEEIQHDKNPELSLNLLTYKEQYPHILYATSIGNLSMLDNFSSATFVNTYDVYEAVLAEGADNINRYWKSMPIALSVRNDSFNGMYSTSLHHALPIAVNTLTNILAAEMIPNLSGPVIFTNNYPILDDDSTEVLQKNGKSFFNIMIWSAGLTMGTFILQFAFMPFQISEQKTFFRSLQQLAGVNPFVYWVITFAYDVLICTALSFGAVFLIDSTDPDHIFNVSKTNGFLLIHMILHNIAGMSFVYLLSLYMKSSDMGYISFLTTVIIGIIFSTLTLAETMSKSTSILQGRWLGYILHMIPSYSFNNGLLKIGMIGSQNTQCLNISKNLQLDTNLCCVKDEVTGACFGLKNYYNDAEYGIWMELMFSVISAIICIAMFMLTQFKIQEKLTLEKKYKTIEEDGKQNKNKMENSKEHESTFEDDMQDKNKEDNKEHKITVEKMHKKKKNALKIEKVTKLYTKWMFCRAPKTAVNNINMELINGQCLGIIGNSGAGKTTIFKMLIQDEYPTEGCISLQNSTIGYCPEFNAIDEYLTGREVLRLFCKLRGTPKENITATVKEMLEQTGLTELADTMIGIYSGGNKRKLSVATALIANSNVVVLLDEPTSGVDPFSKNLLHKAIIKAKERNCSILLSSHVMDDFVKICDELCVLRKGELVKESMEMFKDTAKITITLKLRIICDGDDLKNSAQLLSGIDPTERLKSFNELICVMFGKNWMKKYTTILQILVDSSCGYLDIFDKLNKINEDYPDVLEDYMINDSTFEEVVSHKLNNGETCELLCNVNV